MNSEISITVLATGFSLGVTELVGLADTSEDPRDSLPPAMRGREPPRGRDPPPSKRESSGGGGVPGFLRR